MFEVQVATFECPLKCTFNGVFNLSKVFDPKPTTRLSLEVGLLGWGITGGLSSLDWSGL